MLMWLVLGIRGEMGKTKHSRFGEERVTSIIRVSQRSSPTAQHLPHLALPFSTRSCASAGLMHSVLPLKQLQKGWWS